MVLVFDGPINSVVQKCWRDGITFDCHWKSRSPWVWTKKVHFVRARMHHCFFEIYKRGCIF